ncbi:NAD(P)-binding protein [Pseudoalteromonas viridis]|uniref:NAD(P)-binding protein n=1 Tax=Pseudoalteromonas viridis TaxID=339617 RepID=A0ABX7V6Q5_9GAMM|nr:NAD(P)-binding protein [Pseudoalteromonas viridis]QTL34219.1 NAD(P)-binding protein [Pseudoalteromonas viridis]
MKKKIIVVGGGLTGLFAVNRLQQLCKGAEITLLESSEHCGGLLNCFTTQQGTRFDQGTHLASKTGNSAVDEILFGTAEEESQNWSSFSYLNAGNLFAGTWNYNTQVADIRSLPTIKYKQCVADIMTANSEVGGVNFKSFVTQHMGPALYEELFLPVVRKLYGYSMEAEQLAASTGYFGLNRVVAFDTEVTSQLKNVGRFDEKLAFDSSQHYARHFNVQEQYLYPKHGRGIHYWTDRMLDRALAGGANVLCGVSVSKLLTDNSTVTGIQLSDGMELACDHVIWSAPAALALKLADIKLEHSFRPELRTANLFHFMFDKPVTNAQNHYVWIWDRDYQTFRITLYDNFSGRAYEGYRVTAEVLSNREESQALSLDVVKSELVKMGLITAEHQVLDQAHQVIHNTFPVPSLQLESSVAKLLELANSTLSNVTFAGRHSASAWLQADVINKLNKQLENHFS